MSNLSFQVLISFLFGGFLISLQSIVAERVPQTWRGVILGLPTTMLLGFLFIGLFKTPEDVQEASIFLPAALASDYLFVLGFTLLARRSLFSSISMGLLFWLIPSILILQFPPSSLVISFFIYCLPAVIISYLLIKNIEKNKDIKPISFSWKLLLMRSLIGGTVVALIVITSQLLGNIWGAILSAFPAAFSSVLSIYYKTYGKEIVPTVSRSMFFPAIFGFTLYGVSAGYFYPQIGVWLGTLASLTLTLVFYFLYQQGKKSFHTRTKVPPPQSS